MPMQDKLKSIGYMYSGEDCPAVIQDVYNTLKPASVLDVGCGPCRSMGYFKAHGVSRVVGIDGSSDLLKNPNTAEHRAQLILVDLEKSPCVLGERFDLVWSYEVAEHIENEENFLITLTENAAQWIVMTAAPPEQGGTHHVNCQPREHWIEKLDALGFDYEPELVAQFGGGGYPQGWQTRSYMAYSGMVFKRREPIVPYNKELGMTELKIAGYYCCYKDKRATYESLRAFRQHYPDALVHLVSDGGDDFTEIAQYFKCEYFHETLRSGNGKSTLLETNEQVMLWLNRLKRLCMSTDADWIVILEDDVLTRGKIKYEPPAPLSGPCTMEFTHKAKAVIRKMHKKKIEINGYSGCGGSILHRETFLKCMENMFDIAEMAKKDHRLAHHSDAILTFLFLYNGYENKLWLDQSETSQGRGRPDAAFDHQYKVHYGKKWDDAWLKTGIPVPKPRGRGLPMRFHLLGLAHLPARWEYSPCAYTYKILRLAKMLKMRGHEVIFYGVENSEVECDQFVPVVSKEMWAKNYGQYDWKKSANFHYDTNDEVHKAFNESAIIEVRRNFEPKDILLCTMGMHHKPIADTFPGQVVESGIGYEGIFAKYKVFESYAWMHFLYGKYGTNDGHNYDAVIPNYYEAKDFPLAKTKPEPYLLHVSRMIERKGIRTSIEVSRTLKVPLLVAGQGDLQQYLDPTDTHIKHVGVVEGEAKMKLFSEATALIQPTVYIGPFEGVVAEAQLCFPGKTSVQARGVEKLYSHVYTGTLFQVCTDNESLECTPEHPFLTQRGWVAAKNLELADQLIRRVGHEKVPQMDSSRIENIVAELSGSWESCDGKRIRPTDILCCAEGEGIGLTQEQSAPVYSKGTGNNQRTLSQARGSWRSENVGAVCGERAQESCVHGSCTREVLDPVHRSRGAVTQRKICNAWTSYAWEVISETGEGYSVEGCEVGLALQHSIKSDFLASDAGSGGVGVSCGADRRRGVYLPTQEVGVGATGCYTGSAGNQHSGTDYRLAIQQTNNAEYMGGPSTCEGNCRETRVQTGNDGVLGQRFELFAVVQGTVAIPGIEEASYGAASRVGRTTVGAGKNGQVYGANEPVGADASLYEYTGVRSIRRREVADLQVYNLGTRSGVYEAAGLVVHNCGVPVLTTDFGCFAETVEQGKTGFRCNTLMDYVQGWERIVAGELSSSYIRERAVRLWDLAPVAKQYEDYFYRLLDLYGKGWYAL